MVDRQEVEALLAACERDRIGPHPDNETLAALCRAWLAVQEAPVGVVVDQWDAGAEVDFDGFIPPDSMTGQRVRIVKEVGDD